MSGVHPGPASGSIEYRNDTSFPRDMDEADPLSPFRERFHLPRRSNGAPAHYFCGNSLGLQPKDARALVESELAKWESDAVDGHFADDAPWFSYHELLRDPGARIVGALPREVVMMNGLTVNLHLMMVSFYRPSRERFKILVESPAFPSDTYAVKTQIRHHGLDPDDALIVARPRPGESTIREEDLEAILEEDGESIALVMIAGVNFVTGQRFDLERIARAARSKGCTMGTDLAHAAGNVPLALHDWGIDFAVWCNYKYLNGGPGCVAGCFVHEKHLDDRDLVRFGGWWGNDPGSRFRMHLEEEFIPVAAADGWQLSNPPILGMAPLRAALALFDEAGFEALRRKSVALTGYLEYLLDRMPAGKLATLTPRDPDARGCQISVVIPGGSRATRDALQKAGIVCDFREPNVIRVAPAPLYNTYEDVRAFADALEGLA